MTLLALIAAFHILAAEALDIDMSSEDRKSSGIYKLNDSEKAALQRWIDANYQKKPGVPTASSTPIAKLHPMLSENLMNSHYLKLSDGSLWHIFPEDIPIAQGWITPVEIIITQSTNPLFPYKLTNKVSGSSVSAEKAEALPSPSAQNPNTGGKKNH